jgi:hypothetical protein
VIDLRPGYDARWSVRDHGTASVRVTVEIISADRSDGDRRSPARGRTQFAPRPG